MTIALAILLPPILLVLFIVAAPFVGMVVLGTECKCCRCCYGKAAILLWPFLLVQWATFYALSLVFCVIASSLAFVLFYIFLVMLTLRILFVNICKSRKPDLRSRVLIQHDEENQI